MSTNATTRSGCKRCGKEIPGGGWRRTTRGAHKRGYCGSFCEAKDHVKLTFVISVILMLIGSSILFIVSGNPIEAFIAIYIYLDYIYT